MSNFNINPDAPGRIRAAQAEQAARLEQQLRAEKLRRNRPVWTKINRLELLIAAIVIGAIALWILYVVLS